MCVLVGNPNLSNASDVAAYNECWAVDAAGFCVACADGSCALAAPPSPTSTLSVGATPSTSVPASVTASPSPTAFVTRSVSATGSPTPTLVSASCGLSPQCVGCAGGCDVDGSCDVCDDGFTLQPYATDSAVAEMCAGEGLCLNATNPKLEAWAAGCHDYGCESLGLNYVAGMLACWHVDADGWCDACAADSFPEEFALYATWCAQYAVAVPSPVATPAPTTT